LSIEGELIFPIYPFTHQRFSLGLASTFAEASEDRSPPRQAKLAEPPLLAQERANISKILPPVFGCLDVTDYASPITAFCLRLTTCPVINEIAPPIRQNYLFSQPFCFVHATIKILTLAVFLGSNNPIQKFF
jgi:hypothetical protein